MTYKARLNAKVNGAARVRFYSRDLQDADRMEMIRAKAAATRRRAAQLAEWSADHHQRISAIVGA